MYTFFASNPFIDAWSQSDFIGKGIFLSLLLLSAISWTLIAYKVWITYHAKKSSATFQKQFFSKKETPLDITSPKDTYDTECPNAFGLVYDVLQQKTHAIQAQKNDTDRFLSAQDIALLETQADAAIGSLHKFFTKHLYILSTVVTLAPFLGLLGTVYGILTTFSAMQTTTSFSSQIVLNGLSLALTTTVIGLIDAIPALIGYNYLKNSLSHFTSDMQHFATNVLTQLQLYHGRDSA